MFATVCSVIFLRESIPWYTCVAACGCFAVLISVFSTHLTTGSDETMVIGIFCSLGSAMFDGLS